MDEEEEDLSGLHPGALLYRSAALQNFPVMADALAHGADVNWVNVGEESSTPLIQAVTAVSEGPLEGLYTFSLMVLTCLDKVMAGRGSERIMKVVRM